jgi:hypothetical protein
MKKTFTLREFCNKYPEIHNTMEDLIKPFHIPLFFPDSIDTLKSHFGGGVCTSLSGLKGILTDHHVAEIFIKREHGYVYTTHPKTCELIPLKFKRIIFLPKSDNTTGLGVDIAFIELAPEADISGLDKQWWDLDASSQKYLGAPDRYWAEENISFWSWGLNATPGEGAVLLEEPSSSKKEILYPKAGFHWVAVSPPALFPCSLSRQSKLIDSFSLPISREGIDGPSLPKSYAGTSGNGLWQIELADTDEGLKIQEIQLAGLVTEESQQPPHPVKSLICRGHVSLYETFVPFCKAILADESIETALKKAGFET